MNYRYRLHPGQITDRRDGKVRFVEAHELARLYGVDMKDCIVADPHRAFDRSSSYRRDPYADLIQLHPRSDGEYGLFTLHWRDGRRDIVIGAAAAVAITKAGYGARSVDELAFWTPGDDRAYEWVADAREWMLVASLPAPIEE